MVGSDDDHKDALIKELEDSLNIATDTIDETGREIVRLQGIIRDLELDLYNVSPTRTEKKRLNGQAQADKLKISRTLGRSYSISVENGEKNGSEPNVITPKPLERGFSRSFSSSADNHPPLIDHAAGKRIKLLPSGNPAPILEGADEEEEEEEESSNININEEEPVSPVNGRRPSSADPILLEISTSATISASVDDELKDLREKLLMIEFQNCHMKEKMEKVLHTVDCLNDDVDSLRKENNAKSKIIDELRKEKEKLMEQLQEKSTSTVVAVVAKPAVVMTERATSPTFPAKSSSSEEVLRPASAVIGEILRNRQRVAEEKLVRLADTGSSSRESHRVTNEPDRGAVVVSSRRSSGDEYAVVPVARRGSSGDDSDRPVSAWSISRRSSASTADGHDRSLHDRSSSAVVEDYRRDKQKLSIDMHDKRPDGYPRPPYLNIHRPPSPTYFNRNFSLSGDSRDSDFSERRLSIDSSYIPDLLPAGLPATPKNIWAYKPASIMAAPDPKIPLHSSLQLSSNAARLAKARKAASQAVSTASSVYIDPPKRRSHSSYISFKNKTNSSGNLAYGNGIANKPSSGKLLR